MAGFQCLPPLLLLALGLLQRPDGNFSASSAIPIGVTRETKTSASKPWIYSSNHSSPSLIENFTNHFSISEAKPTIHSSTLSSESDSTTPHSPSNSEETPTIQPSSTSTGSGLASTSLQPETTPHSSSGFPSSELIPTSHSSPPNSTTLTLHWSPTFSSPRTESPTMPLATTDHTSVISGIAPGDTEAPELSRNPGVVVAVCLLLSILLIGSVVMAVRYCHQGVSEFQKLDEVSMGTVSQRSSFAHCPPE